MEQEEEEEETSLSVLLSALPLRPSSSSSDDESTPQTRRGGRRRNICDSGCGRPSSVCLCPYLPSSPLPTATQILLLHHPHSLSSASPNTLSTIPPLSLSLLSLLLLPGRKLRLGSHPLLDSLCLAPSRPVLFLFPSLPSSPSLPISLWAQQNDAHRRPPVLIVFDGTWSQAREMVNASLPFLRQFATHVSVGDCDERVDGPSSFEYELAVRKEPVKGCVSTMEAVARALRVLEKDGEEIEERLVGVLRAMVGFQTRHLKAAKPRIKMRKKDKRDGDGDSTKEICSTK